MFLDEISRIYIAYTTHKVVYKFHGSIYKRENAINIEVQPKVLLNVSLGVLLKARFARAITLARGAPSPLFSLVHNYKYYFMRISDIFFNQRCSCLSTRFIFLRLFIFFVCYLNLSTFKYCDHFVLYNIEKAIHNKNFLGGLKKMYA